MVGLCGWGEICSEIVWVGRSTVRLCRWGRSIMRLCGWGEIYSEIVWVGGDL